MRLLRTLHKWLGLIVGLQLLLWTTSGLMFAWLDHHEVMAEHSVRNPAPAYLTAQRSVTEPGAWLGEYDSARLVGITLMPLLEDWFYRVQLTDGIELRRAETGERFDVDEPLVRKLAEARYEGDGTIAQVVKHASSLEARDAGAVWQVQFSDAARTSLYFSAADGRFVVARNDTWRVFDFFWMLHTMDYRGRDNFNNPLVIFAGTGALWLGLSGFILLFRAFRAQELNPVGWWRSHRTPLRIRLASPGAAFKELELPSKPSLYAALQASGVELPSNCGGGGSCGLCVIRFVSDAPTPTSEERHFIAQADLNAGYRLACRHLPSAAAVEVPDSALSHREWSAEVVSSRFVTPTIKELRLRIPATLEFRAGDYVQIAIPPHRSNLADIEVPAPFREVWERIAPHGISASDTPVRRAYSMANFPGEAPGELVLNVRLQCPHRIVG